MNTHESYVSLETAKLLKEAGFDWPCNYAICCDSTHYPNLKEGDVLKYNYLECSELMEGKKPHMLLCPTLDLAQRWLREVKGYYVAWEFNMNIGTWGQELYDFTDISVYIFVASGQGNICKCKLKENYKTIEEALEAGIKKALEIILEKGE